jgi:hypothetical protein
MSVHFSTFGPYSLGGFNVPMRAVDLKRFWEDLDKKEPELANAIGVYVLISGEGKDSLPIYIGQSQSSFRQRLKEVHHGFLRAFEHHPNRELSIIFFPRVSSKKNSFVKKPDNKSLKSINVLEVLLLRDCMTLNRHLLNKKEKTFYEGLNVPGYLDIEHSSVTPDARNLQKLLRRKRQ